MNVGVMIAYVDMRKSSIDDARSVRVKLCAVSNCIDLSMQNGFL